MAKKEGLQRRFEMAPVGRRQFQRLVQEAIAGLPPEIVARLDNVDVVVQDWPSKEQLRTTDMDDLHDLLGLYEGIPLTDRAGYNMALPDKITLFRRPLEAACSTDEELVREVQVTIAHEIAHHFGISDERLDALGLG